MVSVRDTQDVNNETYAPDFSKIRTGAGILEDALIDVSNLKKINPRLADKKEVLRAIDNCDYAALRDISNFFYKTSGIYSRLCRYMAYLYRYDWMVTPYINSEKIKEEKILDTFYKVLMYLDNFGIKKFLGEVDLKVIKILNIFPQEFRKGYKLYKEGQLTAEFPGDTSGWYLLDTKYAIKFNMNGEDFPAFASVIPAIIDLDEAQEIDKKRMAQKLLRIIIQKMPVDKNGDLVFDVDEAQQLHNNAVNMLKKAIGIDVLTTFADVEVADMSDNNNTTSTDDFQRVERTVYNEAGVSQMQFNTDGNIALEKSILNDEAAMYNLLLQFETFLNMLIYKFNTAPKKIFYRLQLLTTTIYNYKELAKAYKEQTQLGYSKMLPQIALGQSQSSILANAYFENDILDLINVFIPPISSNTMNSDILDRVGKVGREDKENGRPTKESQGESVTEKTIQNQESKS